MNPGGLCCLSDSPQAGFQAVVQIHVRVGVLGPHVGFDPSGNSQWDDGPKAMVPTSTTISVLY